MQKRSDYTCLLLAYLAAWGLLLLNTGFVYWDDWILLHHDAATRDAFYALVAAPQKGMMHNLLQEIGNGVFIYRILVFLAYAVVAACFLWILRHVRQAEPGYPLLIALLAAVYPANQARIALIDLPYGLTLAAFFLATVLAMVGEYRHTLVPRIAALVLFAFSFFTKSLLVYYLVPILLLVYVSRATLLTGGSWQSCGRLIRWGFTHLDYALLPIAFFLLTNRYLAPNTIYEGYNAVTPGALPEALVASTRSLLNLSWFPAVRWFGEPPLRHILVASSLLAASAWLAWSLLRQARARRLEPGWLVVLVVGAGLLLLAILPYHVVNKTPAFDDWLSRHQLLMPFGCAILLVAFCRLVLPGQLARRGIMVLVLIGALLAARDLLWYYADGVRQVGVIAALRANDDIRAAQNQVVLFEDRAGDTNAMGRFYRFYEYSAFLRRAFGDASRFGERRSHWHEWNLEKIRQRAGWRHFNFGDFDADSLVVAGTATLERGDYRPDSSWQRLALLWTGLTDRSELERRASAMVVLRWEPGPG